MARMQNNKTYIVAGLVLFSLMGACAPTNPRPAISSNMDPALPCDGEDGCLYSRC